MAAIPWRNRGTQAQEPTPDPDAPDPQTEALINALAPVLQQTVAPLLERLEALEGRTAAPAQSQPAPDPDVQPTDFYENPVKAVERVVQKLIEKQFTERGAVPARAAISTAVRMRERELAEQDPGIYELIKEDLEAEKAKFDPQILAQEYPDGAMGIDHVFTQVKGRNMGKILSKLAELKNAPQTRERTRRERVPYVEPGRPRQEASVTSADRLSEEQLQTAARLGITPDEYLEGMRSAEEGRPPEIKLPEPAQVNPARN